MLKQIEFLIVLFVACTLTAAAQTNTFPSSGNAGIGTTSPTYKFDVLGTSATAITARIQTGFTYIDNTVSGTAYPQFIFDSAGTNYHGIWESGLTGSSGGIIIGGSNDAGTGALTVTTAFFNTNTGKVGIGTASPAKTLDVSGDIQVSGSIFFPADSSVQTSAWNGTLTGGDYAESMDVTGSRSQYEPGDVLALDPDHPEEVEKAAKPYSTLVAGVYSTRPGAVGRRQKTDKAQMSVTEVPMAMIGVVPMKVSAENGPIHTGDLLVTSSKSGYAMKGTDRMQMIGAVIGKAMGPLNSGTGVIEALISLQ